MGITAYNQTTGSLLLDDLSVPNRILPASGSGSVILTDYNKVYQIQSDGQLLTYVQSGSVVFDIGTGILNTSSSLALLNNVSSSAILSASNTGSGIGTFSEKQGTTFIFKSISGSGGVVVSSSNGTIIISSSITSGSGTGETNTASNTGSGEGVFANKVGVDLRFRSLSGSGAVSILSSSQSITISSSLVPESLLKSTVKYATTSSIALTGLVSVDNNTVLLPASSGDRILVKHQTNSVDNGIYIASTGSWQRAPDYTSGSRVMHGEMTHVFDGHSHKHSIFVLHSSDINANIGTSTLDYDRLYGYGIGSYIIIPEARVAGNSTRIAQTVLEGGSYLITNPVRFNRIIAKFTAVTSNPTITIQLFQGDGGIDSNVVYRVATVFSASLSSGSATYSFPMAEGMVELDQGIVYCLFGRNSITGSATFRTYVVQTLDLINSDVPAGSYPASFVTLISAATTSSVFFPAVQATSSVADVLPILRLAYV